MCFASYGTTRVAQVYDGKISAVKNFTPNKLAKKKPTNNHTISVYKYD